MNDYKLLRGALSAMFSTESGMSWDEGQSALRRSLTNPRWRSNFEAELRAAFDDPNVSWITLLFNEDYEVYEAASEGDARQFARKLLWDHTFG